VLPFLSATLRIRPRRCRLVLRVCQRGLRDRPLHRRHQVGQL